MSEQPTGKPITNRRLQRMASVLARRQPDIAITLEDVHDPHNISAVLRTCEATAVRDVRLIYDVDDPPELSTGVATGTQRWLSVRQHANVAECYESLQTAGQAIYATALAGDTVDLYDLDLTKPVAFVFGNESRGLSETAIELADATVKIPMMGMAESLNISVACAIVLFEAMRQRYQAGMFERSANDDEEMRATLRSWLERDGRDASAADGAVFDPMQFPPVWPRTQAMPDPEWDGSRPAKLG